MKQEMEQRQAKEGSLSLCLLGTSDCFCVQTAGIRGAVSKREGGSQQAAGAAKTGDYRDKHTGQTYKNDTTP